LRQARVDTYEARDLGFIAITAAAVVTLLLLHAQVWTISPSLDDYMPPLAEVHRGMAQGPWSFFVEPSSFPSYRPLSFLSTWLAGTISMERIVTIVTSEGCEEELIVHDSALHDDTIEVGAVGRRDDMILIELQLGLGVIAAAIMQVSHVEMSHRGLVVLHQHAEGPFAVTCIVAHVCQVVGEARSAWGRLQCLADRLRGAGQITHLCLRHPVVIEQRGVRWSDGQGFAECLGSQRELFLAHVQASDAGDRPRMARFGLQGAVIAVHRLDEVSSGLPQGALSHKHFGADMRRRAQPRTRRLANPRADSVRARARTRRGRHQPARFRTGQMVRTGQKIGEVGESGNASGCHLHYEMWGPPGWYEGGSFLDPTPALRRWDRYS
jgi:hypothetical protein